MFFVYVLQSDCNDPVYYIGVTGDLDRRLIEHNESKNKSTSGKRWKFVYYEAYINKGYAYERESSLKKNRRMRSLLMERVKQSLK